VHKQVKVKVNGADEASDRRTLRTEVALDDLSPTAQRKR
jgi:hypothetical protein